MGKQEMTRGQVAFTIVAGLSLALGGLVPTFEYLSENHGLAYPSESWWFADPAPLLWLAIPFAVLGFPQPFLWAGFGFVAGFWIWFGLTLHPRVFFPRLTEVVFLFLALFNLVAIGSYFFGTPQNYTVLMAITVAAYSGVFPFAVLYVARRWRKRPTSLKSLIYHWGLFFWLTWCAFPLQGY